MIELNPLDRELIQLALREDMSVPFQDVTCDALIPDEVPYQLTLISKQKKPIMFCGMPVINAVFEALNEDVKVSAFKSDGEIVESGEKILTLEGDAKALLMAERTILNFVRHLSAVATLTSEFVYAVSGTGLKILDTRKTTPGMRHLEKFAVRCGGGVNHRMGLYDAMMIKDNHTDLLGGIEKALTALPSRDHNAYPVIVEVRNHAELEAVLTLGRDKVTRVLLDNMTPEALKTSVEMCSGVFETEASGNITLKTIRDVAETGVDYASVGCITHSAGQVDLSMIKQ